MQQPSIFRFFHVDFLPLWDRGPSGPVAAPAPRNPILQNSARMLEQLLVFFTLCANGEAYRRRQLSKSSAFHGALFRQPSDWNRTPES
jgi:hypothetical protein